MLEAHGFKALSELTRAVLWGSEQRVKDDVIRAITINETHWFRDHVLWQELAESILPGLVEQAGFNDTVRVWSAASSTGQELYSIAMLVDHLLGAGKLARRRFEFYGTDIDSSVVLAAQEGSYKSLAMRRGLTYPWTDFAKRYFEPLPRGGARVKPVVRDKTDFYVQNLMSPLKRQARCQLVFLRNVMIYFRPELKREVIRRVAALQRTGDVLILGNAEALHGLSDAYTLESAGKFYRRK